MPVTRLLVNVGLQRREGSLRCRVVHVCRPSPGTHQPSFTIPGAPIFRVFPPARMIPTDQGPRLAQQQEFDAQSADPGSFPLHGLNTTTSTEFPRVVNPANPVIGGQEKPRPGAVITEAWGLTEGVLPGDQVSREEGTGARSCGRLSWFSPSGCKRRLQAWPRPLCPLPPPLCLNLLCCHVLCPRAARCDYTPRVILQRQLKHSPSGRFSILPAS